MLRVVSELRGTNVFFRVPDGRHLVIWWELYGLVTLERWTIGAFVLILLIALLLFAAGGLVLPFGLSIGIF